MTLSFVDTALRYILSQAVWILSPRMWFLVLSSNCLLNRALALKLWVRTQLLGVILTKMFALWNLSFVVYRMGNNGDHFMSWLLTCKVCSPIASFLTSSSANPPPSTLQTQGDLAALPCHLRYRVSVSSDMPLGS